MTDVQALQAALPLLNPKDVSFASSLIAQATKRPLSEKQMFWVKKLTEKATRPIAQRETVEIGDFTGISKLFEKAKAHLKFPKITISGLTLKVAGERARVPGSVNVLQGEDWLGRILQDGQFEKSPRTTVEDRIVDALKAFAADPAKVAGEHGRLTGNCCFCRKELTDKRSTDVGYGPICAAHYDLPWGEKPANQGGLL
jgi:hypothetical protein